MIEYDTSIGTYSVIAARSEGDDYHVSLIEVVGLRPTAPSRWIHISIDADGKAIKGDCEPELLDEIAEIARSNRAECRAFEKRHRKYYDAHGFRCSKCNRCLPGDVGHRIHNGVTTCIDCIIHSTEQEV